MAKVYVNAINSTWDATPKEKVLISQATSCKDKNLWFNPSYRFGAWDGYVHMFSAQSGNLPSGLVPKVTGILKEAGYPVEITRPPFRDFEPRPDSQINFEITEPHQIRALEAMCSYRRGIIHAATNAGKTKIAEAWCSLHDFKVLYIVPTKELLHQTVKSFKKDTNLEVGFMSAEDGWEIGRDVTVALASSIIKRKDKKTGKILNERAVKKFKEIAAKFEAVIVDECHHLQADGWRWIMKALTNAHYRYGLSGTPWNPGDEVAQLRVESYLGPIIARVTNAELIEKGWSAKPIINMVPVRSANSLLAPGESEYQKVYDMGIVYNDCRNSIIAKLSEDFRVQGKTCLIIGHRIAQCEILSDLLKVKKIPHRLILGSSGREERKNDFEDFKKREFPILISNVLGEGVDIPSLNGLIFASGGKSSKQMLQRVGRGIRRKPEGENVVEIYDFSDESHGILKHHTRQRLKLYEKEGFEICEKEVFF